jgi:L-methionine (R)-S-oxide reductase
MAARRRNMLHCSKDFKRAVANLQSFSNPGGERAAAPESRMTQSDAARVLPSDKPQRYRVLLEEIASVVQGETNRVARMATIASMLAAAFDRFFWTGFYMVDPTRDAELVVGPYQGTLGCLRIAFGRGVCGSAAASRRTVLVPDVEAFADHIACDSRSRSEIVVPVFDREETLIAVLDVDSTEPAAFDEADRNGLEAIVRLVAGD